MFKQTDPENAVKIELLAGLLETLPIGQVLTYSAMSGKIGTDVQASYWLLKAAREKAEKNLGCLYEPERGIGIRRLESATAPEVGLSAIGKVRRIAKRSAKRLARLNTNSLSEPEQRRVIGYTAMLGAIATVADGRRAQVIGAIVDPVKPIPPASILRMFAGEGQT
jgi:hypothetical protein